MKEFFETNDRAGPRYTHVTSRPSIYTSLKATGYARPLSTEVALPIRNLLKDVGAVPMSLVVLGITATQVHHTPTLASVIRDPLNAAMNAIKPRVLDYFPLSQDT